MTSLLSDFAGDELLGIGVGESMIDSDEDNNGLRGACDDRRLLLDFIDDWNGEPDGEPCIVSKGLSCSSALLLSLLFR